MKKSNYFIVLVAILFHSCVQVHYDDLTYYEKINTTTKVKTNGYYVADCSDNCNNCKGSNKQFCRDIFVLYRDGTIFFGNYFDESKTSAEKVFARFRKNKDLKHYGGFWGCYMIEKDTLKIQELRKCNECGLRDERKVVEYKYPIRNDTTIFSLDSRGKYKFVKCTDCKPDSDNYIKEYFRRKKLKEAKK